jgi:hypothetical protein
VIVGALIGLLIFAVLLGGLLGYVFLKHDITDAGFAVLLVCILTVLTAGGALVGAAV